jgi:O-antigen/teichoic acid export membrane protein
MKDRKQTAVIALSTVVVLMAAAGFAYKMAEFAETILKDDLHGFGVSAIVTYLIGMFALLFLNVWAFLRGYFRDLEGPKYRMLEMEEDYERIERTTGRAPKVGAVAGKER